MYLIKNDLYPDLILILVKTAENVKREPKTALKLGKLVQLGLKRKESMQPTKN